jgi:ERCC4-type nuclease
MDQIIIKIDNREHDLYHILENQTEEHISIVKEVLLIGDIIISYKGTDLCIIERKTIPDLLSSVKDGRYDEQSHRLLYSSNMPPHNIIYLIEGKMAALEHEKKQAYGAMVSLNYFKGFSVFWTNNIRETAEYIVFMALKMKLNVDDDKFPTWNNNIHVPHYSSVVKSCKKNNITTKNIHEIMLAQIPSVSHVTSAAIFTTHKSLKNLIQVLHSDKTALDNMTYETKGKKRKFSKTAIGNIIKFLFDENEENGEDGENGGEEVKEKKVKEVKKEKKVKEVKEKKVKEVKEKKEKKRI